MNFMSIFRPGSSETMTVKAFFAVAATVTALLAVNPGPSRAATSNQEAPLNDKQVAAVRTVGAYFNKLKSLRGEFVQVGPRGHISSGIFYLAKPGRLRFEYSKPNPFLIVADGTWLVVNNRKKNKADYYPLSQTPLRLVLSEEVNLLKDAKILHVDHNSETITVTLEDRDQLVSGQLTVVYDHKGGNLKQWVIIDGQGLRTTISLKSLTDDVAMDPGLFKVKLRKEIKNLDRK